MTAARKRLCNTPGCGAVVSRGYCPACKRRRTKTANRNWDPKRQESKRFYNSSRWRALSKAYLDQNPLCVECRGAATEVDHILSKETVDDPYDERNLQSLCHSCHSRKTMLELRRELWGAN